METIENPPMSTVRASPICTTVDFSITSSTSKMSSFPGHTKHGRSLPESFCSAMSIHRSTVASMTSLNMPSTSFGSAFIWASCSRFTRTG